MAKLIYSAMASLDGYLEDEEGRFEWAAPDEQVHAFANDLERSVGTHLYGRRMYETMSVWETDPTLAAASEVMADFAEVWQAADKVVYYRTLDAPPALPSRDVMAASRAADWRGPPRLRSAAPGSSSRS